MIEVLQWNHTGYPMREALMNYESVFTKHMLLENTSLLVSSAPFTFVQIEVGLTTAKIGTDFSPSKFWIIETTSYFLQ
jgi:hypothetical protein